MSPTARFFIFLGSSNQATHTFCLSIFIDDATSRITAAQFSPTESSETYLAMLEAHVRKYGITQAFYSD